MRVGAGRKPTIASRLVWLVVGCTLPAALIAAVLLVNQYRQEKVRLAGDALDTARALAADVDRELAGLQAGLFALATSPYLDANDLRAFHAQALLALGTMNANNIVLVDSQGRQLVNTLRALDAPVPSRSPAQVLRVFETGRPSVTGLFKGTALQRPLVAVNVPVRRDDHTVYVLGAAMLPDRLSALLAQQHLAPGWISAILDAEGKFLARTQGIERFLGQQGAPQFVAATKQAREGILETDTVDGIPAYSAYAYSGVSGWTVGIAVPREQLAAQLRRSLQQVVAITAVLLAAGLAFAWTVGGGIARAVRGLTGPAHELALERPIAIPELGLREADEVGQILAETSVRLRAATSTRELAERDLRQSHEQLRRIIDNMFAFVGLLSLDGRVLEVNRAPLEAAGLTREEVIGRPCVEMLWFNYSAEAQERLQGALARVGAGETVRYDETIAVRDGRFMVIDLMLGPLRDMEERIHRIVASATDVTERQRAADRLRELAGRLMETEETERRKLNRELHHRVAANLAATGLGLGIVRSQLPPGTPAAAGARLDELIKLLAQTTRQARDLMAELSPPALTDYGLFAALNTHAETMKARSGLEIAVQGAELEPRPSLAVETALFRIALEALSNVLKHAGTRHAEIRLASRNGSLAMTISDAGSGFNPGGAAPADPTWGMRTMRERAEAIGAILAVDSSPGRGTRVSVELRGQA